MLMRRLTLATVLLALVGGACAQAPPPRPWVSFDGPTPPGVRLETAIPAESAATAGPQGQAAWRVLVPSMDRDEKACAFHLGLPGLPDGYNAARLWLRGSDKTRRVEVVFRTPEGSYGRDFALTADWQEYVLGPREALPLLGTQGGRLTLTHATEVRFCFGAWQGNTGGPHEVSVGPISALYSPLAEPVAPPVSLDRPALPLPRQPFTVELLDLARGQWAFPDALGQRLQLAGPVFAQAYTSGAASFATPTLPAAPAALRLGYLCCDPEFPDDLAHATLRVVSALPGAADTFRIEEPYFTATVTAREAEGEVYRCELRDLLLGPATTGDRYVAGLYLLAGGRVCPLHLAAGAGEEVQVRLATDRVGHVFSDPEPVTVSLTGLCPGAARTLALALALQDYATGETLWRGTQPLACKARAATTATVTIPLKRYGIFRLTAAGAAAPATLRLCRLPAVRKVDPETSRIGMNLFQQQIWWYAYQVPLLARAGVHWIRPWLAWENVWALQQPQADAWDTRALDAALRRLEAHGMRYEAILFRAPGWATGGTGWSAPPEDKLASWSEYVRRIVTQYKGRIRDWEIWNEPDLMWPEQTRHQGTHYVALLKAAYLAAKAANPDCRVHGLSHAGYMDWLERVGEAGAKDYFDIATIHSYASPADYTAAVNQRRKLLERYGMGGKPLWINELGATAYDFSPEYSRKYSCSELKQASVLTANYALSLSEDLRPGGTPGMKAFWFCTYDPRDSAHESGWAWDAGIGVLYLGFLPKLAYPALAGVARELDGRTCVGRARLADPSPEGGLGLQQVSFTGPLSVVWSDRPERPGARAVPAVQFGCLPNEELRVRDAYTNPVARGRAGQLRLDLSRGPLYLEGSAQLAALARAEQAVALSAEEVSLAPGGSAQVTVRAPAGATVTTATAAPLPLTVRRSPAQGGNCTLTFTAAAGAGRASAQVRVLSSLAKGNLGLRTPVTVERLVTVNVGEPNLIRGGDLPSSTLGAWAPERTSAWAWDAGVAHSGPGSLRLDGPFDRRLVHWKITPTAGRALKLRCWARSRDLQGGVVTLNIAFFADKWLGSWCLAATGPVGGLESGWQVLAPLAKLPTGTSDWTLVEAELPADKVPVGATNAAFYLDAKGGGGGSIWFDDFDLWQPAQ